MKHHVGRIVDQGSGTRIDLPELAVLGRDPRSTVVIGDSRASRRHALIRRQSDGFWFVDLGSVNGSTVNGRRVTTALRLADGDHIVIASHLYHFEGDVSHEDESETKTLGDQTVAEVKPTQAILLVSDIWGFTSLSEQLETAALAQVMGSWYSLTGDILNTMGATIDKFIGDCVLAYWLDTSDAARRSAVEAAIRLRDATQMVATQHSAVFDKLGQGLSAGVAVHRGSLVYGAFGAGEFTLIGDAVNLAFRLESMTRALKTPVVLSADLLEGWDEGRIACHCLGSHPVKGRTEPVEVWTPEVEG